MKRKPSLKVLLYDLETSPNIGYTWGKWEQNVIAFIEEKQVICFAWKWLGEKGVHVLALPDLPGYDPVKRNNKLLIAALHRLFKQADITVSHNGDRFDEKLTNTELIRHGFKPIPPHRSVDTCKFSRSKFLLNSNKLDDLGSFFHIGNKVKHPGFSMWLGCLKGNKKSWAQMKHYNKGDVSLLERLYLKERPWMTNHPAMNPDGMVCQVCESNFIQRRGRSIRHGHAKRYQCRDCGHWMQETKYGVK